MLQTLKTPQLKAGAYHGPHTSTGMVSQTSNHSRVNTAEEQEDYMVLTLVVQETVTSTKASTSQYTYLQVHIGYSVLEDSAAKAITFDPWKQN